MRLGTSCGRGGAPPSTGRKSPAFRPWEGVKYAIGVLELGAGLALLFRRSAAPAALLLGVVMVGAAASHLRAGDGVLLALPALVLLALLAVAGAARRGDLLAR